MGEAGEGAAGAAGRRRLTVALAGLLLLSAAGGGASARTVLTVCPDGSGQYPTIQMAVDAAPAGAAIELCDGVFEGPGNRDVLLGDRFLTIRSVSGDTALCVVRAGGSPGEPHRAFVFRSGVDTCAVLEDLTVEGGRAALGGGILCEADSSGGRGGPLLRGCLVRDCTADEGGGIAVDEAAVWLEGCTLRGNAGGNLFAREGARVDARDSEFSGSPGDGVSLSGPQLFTQGRFQGCRLLDNEGNGITLGYGYETVEADSCRFEGNGGWGLSVAGAEDAEVTLQGCRLAGNGAGGARLGDAVFGTVAGCRIEDNGSEGGPGLLLDFPFGQSIEDCVVAGNGGDGVRIGSGVKARAAGPQSGGPIVGCEIRGNGGWGVVAGGYLLPLELSGTVLAGNAAGGLDFAVDASAGCDLLLDGCTVAYNGGPGLRLASAQSMTVAGSIVAFNAAGAALCLTDSVPALSCSDLYGNLGGDWTGPIAGLADRAGNLSLHPLFCDPVAGDLTLAAASPCAADTGAGGCGVLGARGIGCAASALPDRLRLSPAGPPRVHPGDTLSFTVALLDTGGLPHPGGLLPPAARALTGAGEPDSLLAAGEGLWRGVYRALAAEGPDTLVGAAPECVSHPADSLALEVTPRAIIDRVADVAGDQGLQVRVTWQRDLNDTLGAATPVVRYVVWRRVDDPAKALPGRPVLGPGDGGLLADLLAAGEAPLLAAAEALWEPVGPQVPAMMWSRYASVVPTLGDSTAAGIHWSVFMVSAHTENPQLFRLSAPDSGWSVDDLAPAPPLGFAAAYAADGNHLRWLPHPAPDFLAFRVYRGEEDGFTPAEADLVVTTGDTTWTDLSAEPWRWRYLLTAVDDGGRESEDVAPETVTAVGGRGGGSGEATADGKDLPARPTLRAAAPNPFNPRVRIVYALPAGGAVVRLEIYDARGRRVRSLPGGPRAAGRHEVVWAGDDDAGHALGSGTYLCRLAAGGREQTVKLTLVR